MFVVVSFAGRLVVYKIVYMLLFLLCLTLFQVPGGGRGEGGGARGTTPAHHAPPPGLLQPVEEAAEAVLVAGGRLHHAGAHRRLHLPVPGLPQLLAQPDGPHGRAVSGGRAGRAGRGGRAGARSGSDGRPLPGWGTWAWSSSACRSSSPASSSPASSCSRASCSCTTSTSPSCSSPTWSTCARLAPASRAGPTGACPACAAGPQLPRSPGAAACPPHCPGTEEGREGGQWVPTGGPRAERRPQLPPSNTAGGPGGCWGRRNGRGLWGQPQELG